MMLLLFSGVLFGSACMAQGGYTVSGRIQGLAVAKVRAVAADFGAADTLASSVVANGGFMLRGTLPGDARAVTLIFEGVDGTVPLLLENGVNYQVSVTSRGAAIEGEGPAAGLLKAFERVARDYAAERGKVESEYKAVAGDASREASLQSRLDNAYRQSVEKTLELIRANADSYVSAYVIALNMTVDDESSLRAKYELLSPSARESVPGKVIAAMLARYGSLVEGEIAPNYTLTKPDGNTFTIHNIPAKWKVIHFWAARQGSSRVDNSELVKLYLQYCPKGLEIISVSLDDNHAMWKQGISYDGMIWTNGSDLKGEGSEIARLYLVKGLPTYYLLDGENHLVAKGITLDELRAKLADLTKRKKKKK